MKEFVNKYKYLLVSIGAVIIALVLYLAIQTGMSITHFDTPEKAFYADNTKPCKELLTMQAQGDVAYVLFIDKENEIQHKYILKDERGWISPTGHSVFNEHSIYMDTGIISYVKDHGYIFFIHKAYDISANPTKDEIKDSIGSQFCYYYVPNGTSSGQYWFVNLKELPDSYSITINEKGYKIT